MKKLLIASLIGISAYSFAGISAGRSPKITAQSLTAATQDTTKQKANKVRMDDRMRRGQIEDRRPTGNPDPKQMRPDSLRRGGATKVDTVRH
jgi:hypothetical protein